MAAATLAPFAADEPLQPVNLRSTAHFAVLSASLISNVPTSAITGDIGLSPAGGSMITGFGNLEVTGTIFTVDATGPAGSTIAASDLSTAKGDLTLAYDDAAGRTPVPAGPFLNPGSGNIGGLTLIPGLYKFTSTLSITGSDVTLTGNADDVWIFQIASDLVVGDGIQVTLAGGAKAANIFWQVGTSATLGTTCKMKGTIMADQSISLNTGATLDGRALASIAAVTLASNTITRPATSTTLAKARARNGFSIAQGFRGQSGSMQGLAFTVPSKGRTTVKLVSTSGRELATLFDGQAAPGETTMVPMDSRGLAKGLYFTMLRFNGQSRLTSPILID
ncbi:MAG: hypothetical protein JWP91_3856 [Fibrobacteres bacterium]|nr:hypothetical protein [Fibrobacterota bacterium]